MNPQWLELPLPRTNFHSPKGVRAIKIRPYLHKTFTKNVLYVKYMRLLCFCTQKMTKSFYLTAAMIIVRSYLFFSVGEIHI